MIIIGGATATGKSHVAIALAKAIGGELISCDSAQVYKGMDVGTAKENGDIGVNQHLIDVVEPCESFTVVDFRTLAREKILEIRSRGNVPIIVGGTGLYIDSLLYEMEYGGGSGKDDTALKESLKRELEERGAEYMHAKLNELDPVTAEKVHANNVVRVLRALYVVLHTGKPISAQNAKFNPVEPFKMFVIKRDRQKLHERINTRVVKMVEEGLKGELEALLAKGYGFNLQSMQAIGYKEWQRYFEDGASIEDVIEQIQVNTRQYAKRQDTWFNNRYKGIATYFDIDNQLVDEVVNCMIKEINLL